MEEEMTTDSEYETRETKFLCILQDYESIEEAKVCSPWHKFEGYRWRMVIYPKGDDAYGYLSSYLECGGPLKRDIPSGIPTYLDLSYVSVKTDPNPLYSLASLPNWKVRIQFKTYLYESNHKIIKRLLELDLFDKGFIEDLDGIDDDDDDDDDEEEENNDTIIHKTECTFDKNDNVDGMADFITLEEIPKYSYENNLVFKVCLKLRLEDIN